MLNLVALPSLSDVTHCLVMRPMILAINTEIGKKRSVLLNVKPIINVIPDINKDELIFIKIASQ